MKYITSLALSACLIGLPACSQAGEPSELSRQQIEKIVKDYLMENPEIVRDALLELDAREERAAIEAVRNDVFHDKRDISIGPKDAKVTIVEFFDYNCGFCKRSTDWIRETLDNHPNDVRVIFKELPLLDGRTKTSRNAAKAALAAARQGKYDTMHFSLMAERSLTKDRIDMLAEKAGLDMVKFRKDIQDPALSKQLEDAMTLAARMPMFSGTPFFFINDDYISGANTERLDAMLEAALEG